MTAPELTAAGAEWYKASYTSGNNNCVEVARNLPGMSAVRDSKDPQGAALTFEPEVFSAFLSKVKSVF